jgi:hypothetical protein
VDVGHLQLSSCFYEALQFRHLREDHQRIQMGLHSQKESHYFDDLSSTWQHNHARVRPLHTLMPRYQIDCRFIKQRRTLGTLAGPHGLGEALAKQTSEIVPHKILPQESDAVKLVVTGVNPNSPWHA